MHPFDEKAAFCQLAVRCLTGIASDAERQRLREQLDEPEKGALFEKMRLSWERSPTNRDNGCDVGDLSRRLAQAVASEPEAETEVEAQAQAQDPAWLRPARFRPWFSGPALAAAAALALAAISPVLWSKWHTPTAAKTQPIVWVQETCGVSERAQIALSDGTKITLNSGSTLFHPKTFGTRNRVVRLTGEAFFDVTHDESRPFIIDTSSLRIKVLGTQFNVRAFADGSEAKVTLVKGKVEVSELTPNPSQSTQAPQPVFLSPGQEYDFATETRKAGIKPVSTEAATGWMRDRLFWNHEPAASAMRELERRFGIAVEFTDPKLGRLRLDGHFEQESLEDIFEILHMTEVFNDEIVRGADRKITRVILSPGRFARLSLLNSRSPTPQAEADRLQAPSPEQ